MFEVIFAFLLIFTLVMLLVALICIPIMIANMRGITGNQKTIIVALSWLGIFFGFTWVVALILSLVWGANDTLSGDNLEKLEKLSKLYKDKVITKDEFERQKKKYLL